MDASTRSALAATTMAFAVCTGLSACSFGNNPVLGRVDATVSDHEVVVTNCYRLHVPDVKSSDGGQQWAPCKNASVTIKDEMLFVNGEAYGPLRRATLC